MLLAFAVLSFTAATTKNSTYDETLHIPSAWANLHGDFRANPEHPPLWKYWSALPHLLWPFKIDHDKEDWQGIPQNPAYEWNWGIDALYRTPGNNADAITNHARFMMMLIAVGLGATLIVWAWRLGGAMCAIVAGALYCFDPNFLAHGSLVTNDVALSLCFLAWIWAIWNVGREATARRIWTLCILCGVAVNVKFSGLLLGPLTLLLLFIRAGLGPWRILGTTVDALVSRFAAAIGICILAVVMTYGMIWATYQFRYSAIPDGQPLAWSSVLGKAQFTELYSQHPGTAVNNAERADWHPSLLTRFLFNASNHHLLPEAFCFGVLYVHASGLVRSAYLLSQISPVGWWYYFPLAILFKTPAATLIAFVIAALVGWSVFSKGSKDPERRWLAIAIAIPTIAYLVFMMAANLDLGIRHILEIYPPIYLGAGLAMARLHKRPGLASHFSIGILGLLLMESLFAFPNYIPFFNFPSGGWRGGIKLLGDSNLDWGQDLKSLGQWQKSHRDQRLYLLYFGSADPAYYGIQYINLPGSYIVGPSMQPPSTPGIIAASATDMQGIYLDDAEHRAYGWMLHAEPIEVFGGSIYLFQYPYHGPWHP